MNDGENNYFNSLEEESPEQAAVKTKKSDSPVIFMIGMIAGILVTMFLGCIVYLAVFMNNSSKAEDNKKIVVKLNDEETLASTGIADKDKVYSSEDEDSLAGLDAVAKILALEKTIDDYFFLDRPDNETLRNGMYKGLMDALGDRYSEYYTPEELNELMEETEGIYYGIGAYVSLDPVSTLPKISGIINNSPAQDSNLRPNDIISEVNGESTYGLTLNEVVGLIKGPEGTEVVLTIIRENESELLYETLIRRQVEAPSVEYAMLEDKMAKIQVTEFDEATVDQFEAALTQARSEGAKGIILDLRANPGGSLSAVVAMCRQILPKGMIVYTENKSGKRNEYKCDGKHELELPLVVLVDMNSASAAEIMAGAIKDYGIGTLIGTTTFGKGIVQQIIPFADGSAVKVTVSAYYTPNGTNIHGIGIEPDIVCEFDGEAYYDTENPVDNQLEKAKEVLRGKMK